MPEKQQNLLERFFDADRVHNPDHSHRWWGSFFGLDDPSIVSSWVGSARRRIGPKHEEKVFAALDRYWNDHPEFASYRFTLEEYRRSVPTAKQREQRAARTRSKRRTAMRRTS